MNEDKEFLEPEEQDESNIESYKKWKINNFKKNSISAVPIEILESLNNSIPEGFLDSMNRMSRSYIPDYSSMIKKTPILSFPSELIEPIQKSMIQSMAEMLESLPSRQTTLEYLENFTPKYDINPSVYTSRYLKFLFKNISDFQMKVILDSNWMPLSSVDYPSDLSVSNVDKFMESIIAEYVDLYKDVKNQYLQEAISSYSNNSYIAASLLAYSTIELIYNHLTQETDEEEYGFKRFDRQYLGGKGFNKKHITNLFKSLNLDVANPTVVDFIDIMNLYFNGKELKNSRNHLGHGGIEAESALIENIGSGLLDVNYFISTKNDADRSLCLMFFMIELLEQKNISNRIDKIKKNRDKKKEKTNDKP